MNTFWQDVRYGLRILAKSPLTTLIVVITLALGIGANTAIFGIVNGFMLRPLPVKSPRQIMVLASRFQGDTLGIFTLSYPELVDLRKQATDFSDIFANQINIGGLSYQGSADRFVYLYVTGNYFSGLGIQPALGRFFLPREGEVGGKDPYVVLGYSYWQKRFGGDPGIVGKSVLIDGQPITVIGVAPETFHGTMFALDADGFLPLNMMPPNAVPNFWTDRTARMLVVLGRLKPDVSVGQAQSSMNVVMQRLGEAYPATDKGITMRVIPEWLARPQPYAKNVVPFIVAIFLALSALVLLLACMNVANILLVRATMRQREMAIRAAMGASRGRLFRLLLTESILLALLGAAGGLLLGEWACRSVNLMLIPAMKLPIHFDFSFDWRVFTYALSAALVSGLLVGLWPAWRAGHAGVNDVLRGSGRSDTAGVGRHRLRSVLVVSQVAGSLVLLIVAGLFVRTLVRAQHTYLGFDPDHLVNLTIDPQQVGYDDVRTKSFYRDLEARVDRLPGVESASLAFAVPMGMVNDGAPVSIEGRQLSPGQQPPVVVFNHVDTPYFDTMRIPLLRGRAFRESDDEHAPLVAVVNQSMAKQFWANEDALGKRFSVKGTSGPWVEVVGIVPDGKFIFIGFSDQPYFFVPEAQNFTSYRTLQVRSSLPPETLIAELQHEVHALEPNLPTTDVETMRHALAGGNGLFVFQVGATLAAAMGLLGLTLAVVGVYGVVSFAAAQRTQEIGIRMALGANKFDILRLVLQQGLILVLVGVCVGTLLAGMLARSMASILVGVSPTDLLTFAGAIFLLAGIGFWACYAPARRAMRLDPMIALRYE